MGQDVDARADLYSCGVMLYEMLAGRKPFESNDLVKLMAMQVTAPPPPLSQVAPDAQIPQAVQAVVMRALEKNREQRFASAREFRIALEDAELATTTAKNALASLWTGLGGWREATSRAVAELGRIVRSRVGGLKTRLPRRVQPWAIPAAAVILVGLIAVWGHSCRRGAAPRLQPPPPKPVAQEMKSPLKEIEDAMIKARFAEARVLIMQQISAHPEVGRVRFLLGNLEFAEKNAAAGLQAYEEALRMDPGLRGDAALLVNVRGLLADKRLAQTALDLLIKQIGVPARATLVELASEDRRPEFRRAARDACESLGCVAEVDKVQSYSLDLSQGRSCAEKREAVEKLGDTKDKRAIEPLRKARYEERGGLLGRMLGGGGNACIIKDIDAALKKLGVEPPTRRRR
jgi:tetratricopeptide (TPR) repeat protein